MDPLRLDGQIQRASILLTGEARHCAPCDAAQAVEIGDRYALAVRGQGEMDSRLDC